ncbi:hypothetical protein A2W24_02375 [Microgenomates group bacterium RBG_16_45_19]|nr:MAG: hypothetical protein A2W24_02375 [Microgenomates group bacterium RBG_16_45_19]
MPVIPLLKPSPSPAEIKAVKRVLQSSWWGLGPVTAQLETAFAAFVGTTYAIAVNSCSAALHLSVHILSRRFPKKTNLVTTPLTFISTAAAGLYENLEVRFGDIEEQTLCLDPQDALAKADALTLTIIPVHYAGILSPIPQTPLPIIEDCAHAAGTPGAGHSSLLACWSFHPVKNIATGDGGMITTNDRQLAAELRRLRWLGIDQDTWAREQKGYNWEYQIPSLGFKYHTNDIMSAIALEQLKRLPTLNRRRRRLAKRYRTGLKDLPLILPPPSGSWHLYPIRLHRASLRPRLIQYLRDHHISVGVHYQPLHHYPFFNWHQPLPVTDRVYPTLLDLPIFPDMTLAEQDYVIHTLHDFYNL